jgi:predicted metal-dependent peptidase
VAQNIDLLPRKSEHELYERFCRDGIPAEFLRLGTGDEVIDMLDVNGLFTSAYYSRNVDWPALFAMGLSHAVSSAVHLAAGQPLVQYGDPTKISAAHAAKDWFISSYPLLGALATTFKVIEDTAICDRMNVGVAAVSYAAREIYINPAAGLSPRECRFVIAHELLHVGLRHDARVQNRDPYLWNVACDFIINGWLMEMELGDMPGVGGLYDPDLKGLSAETIYDRLSTDLRRSRKLMTLRNRAGMGDIIGIESLSSGPAMTLDDAVRRALYQGLEYHEQQSRGYLPADLVEEIRAMNQPPIPWDVELAEWFQGHFSPLEKRRSYARLSRRQSSTPDIPRPSWYTPSEALAKRTFGVIIDTSGSMERLLLAKALGAIASYSQANDVAAARVIFCDARVYDEGYMSPEDIAGQVKVRGRGGTVLQPAIDHLQKVDDFPKDGPILIITDGYCDRLAIYREHAFLIPKSAKLPFPPRGQVFRFE